jgi:tetratricopeptide (TPR) repeat protein
VTRELFRLLSVRIALAFACVLGVALCALPLFSVIGPESALALGLLLSPFSAVVGLRVGLRAQHKQSSQLLVEVVGLSWLGLTVPLLLLALNALRGQACDPWGGLAFMALGPWPSVTLAAIVGATTSTLARPRLMLAAALLLPLANVGRAAHDFVTTPGIFAFGHFFGYFPGTLYDRQVDVPAAWYTLRLLTTVVGAGLWTFVVVTRDPSSSRFSFERMARHPLCCGIVVLMAAVSLQMARKSHALGHTTSSAHVAHTLGLAIEAAHCRVVVPAELSRHEAHGLAEECELRIKQHERALGVRENARITAYFFRSPAEKRALMGAARVYIAKPWRREAYLQLGGLPHPVLAHELAHVVARHAARGPFGVPGKLFGLIPEPTLVEGLAVALEPVSRDELTPHQWAKAAKAAKVAPPLSELLGPRFLSQNQALAYTLAGSFLRYVLDTYGAAKVRALYRSGDVQGTLGRSFTELEKSWEVALAAQPLPSQAEALARQRFERPGVFSQVCPHQVERLEGELGAVLAAGDGVRAERVCKELLAIDPGNTGTRATYAGTLAERGDREGVAHELTVLRGPPSAPASVIAHAESLVADASYVRGDFAAARGAYQGLLAAPQAEAELRQLEVKLLALAAGEPTRSIVAELLIGRAGKAVDARTAMHLIRRLYPLRRDGLAHYLEGRQLAIAGRPDLARAQLESALERGLPTRRLRVEAARNAAVTAFLVGALEAAARHAARLADADATLSERAESADMLQRIEHRRALTAAR